jgi:Fe-S cluster assembly protein SufB
MAASSKTLESLADKGYEFGFFTDVEQDTVPPGLNEDVIRLISAKKDEPEWLLEWRLTAYRHWLTMEEPRWSSVRYPAIDLQAITYNSAPKSKADGPKSLEEVEPEILKTYERLRIPLPEKDMLSGVALDAV